MVFTRKEEMKTEKKEYRDALGSSISSQQAEEFTILASVLDQYC